MIPLEARLIQLQNRLISRGLTLKQARVVMEDLIPILRTADEIVGIMEILSDGHARAGDTGHFGNYHAAWKRITG